MKIETAAWSCTIKLVVDKCYKNLLPKKSSFFNKFGWKLIPFKKRGKGHLT